MMILSQLDLKLDICSWFVYFGLICAFQTIFSFQNRLKQEICLLSQIIIIVVHLSISTVHIHMLPTLQYIYIVLFLFANVRNFSLKQKPLAILRSFKYHSSSPSSSSSATELQLYTTLSFYKFANTPLKNPEEIVKVVSENLKGIDLKGTLVFANEGVNAQITLKDSDLNQFTSILAESDPFLKDINLNIGERKNISQTGAALPFKKLVVRTKKQILTDGLDNNATDIDWSQAGPELDGEAWHNEVKEVPPLKSIDEVSSSSSSKVILLDCRNDYETEMGTFQNSIPLNTVKFSDSWEILEGILADVPKDTRVLTFCTGGLFLC